MEAESENRETAIAVVGFGYWGANLARNVSAAANSKLAYIVDPDTSRQRKAAEAYASATVVSDLAEVLADESVEGVVLSTPASTHAQLAQEVLAAGRHVLVEKPLAMTTEDAAAIVRSAAENERIVMAGHTFLYAEPVRWLKSSIESGALGEVKYLAFQRLSLGRIRTDCNALWNLAPHDVSIAMYLLGERPSIVSASGYSFLQPSINDVYFGSMEFPSGRAVGLHVSWLDPRKERLVTVVGSQRMAVYNDVSADRKIEVFDAGVAKEGALGEYGTLGDFQWRTRTGDIHVPRLELEEPLLREVGEFASAIQEGRSPETSATQGADVVAVLEALDKSAGMGGSPIQPKYLTGDGA